MADRADVGDRPGVVATGVTAAKELVLARGSTRSIRVSIVAIAVAAAVVAAFAGAHPSGSTVADVVLCAGSAAVLTLAASRSSRAASIVASGLAALFAVGPWFVVAFVGLALASVGAALPRRSRVISAAVGALTAQALLRLPADDGLLHEVSFHGASAVIGLVSGGILVVSGYRHATRHERRATRRVAAVLGAVAVVASTIVLATVLASLRDVDKGLEASRQGLSAARNADSATAAEHFGVAEQSLHRADRLLGGWWVLPARAVPIVGQHAKTLDVVSTRAEELARDAKAVAATGDYHDLRYESGHFDLALMERLAPPLQRAADALDVSEASIADLPLDWLLPPLRTKIDSFRDEVADARPDARLASDAVSVAPTILGLHGSQRYLVLFTTPAEQRGLGGFIGAYGELTTEAGGVHLSHSGPIEDLIDAKPRGTRVLHGPPDYVRRYGGFAPQDYLQDLTLSPDFPSVAAVAADLYQQSTGRSVRGVIQLDPYGLAALLELTGPVRVEGLTQPMSADNAPALLLRNQYIYFPGLTQRQDLLQAALKATFEKLTSGDLPGPRELGSVFGPAVRQGRLMLWAGDPAEQSVDRQLGADASMARDAPTDLVSVRGQNSAHNKIDAYLDRRIDVHATIDPATGTVKTAVAVTLHNRAPAAGLPPYVIGNTVDLPSGTNQMTLSTYSSLDPVDVTVDGIVRQAAFESELGWKVASTRVEVPPGATLKVVFDFQGSVPLRDGYRLRLVPQPSATVTKATVRIDGAKGWTVQARTGVRQRGGEAVAGLTLREPLDILAVTKKTG